MIDKKTVTTTQPQSAKGIPAARNVPSVVTVEAGHRVPAPASKRSVAATHGDVAQRAHDIYFESGCVEGRCQENWLQAEADLRDKGAVVCQAEHRVNDVFAPDAVDAKPSALPT